MKKQPQKTPANIYFVSTLIISILAVYYQVFSFEFINYDTPQYVYENANVKNGLSLENFVWAFSTMAHSNWHPLTWISHMVDVTLFGLNPVGHHGINLFFHTLNSLILYSIIKRITHNCWCSWFIASLFALHPLHIQSVAWIAERKDLLSAFFGFLSIYSYLLFIKTQKRLYYLLVILLFMLSLLSKPTLVTLPFILLLMDYWPLKRLNTTFNPLNRKKIALIFFEKWPLLLLTSISCAITVYAQKSGGAILPIEVIPLHDRIFNAIHSYFRYLFLTIYPLNLSILYPFPKQFNLSSLIIQSVSLFSLCVFAIWHINKKPWVFMGWFFFLGTLVPVIGIVQVGMQGMADRYTYIPLIGLFIIFTHFFNTHLTQTESLVRRKLIGFAIIFLLSTISWKELSHWQNSIKLFSRAIEVTSDNFIAHNNLGTALLNQNKYEKAAIEFNKAIQINPDFEIAHLNYGTILSHFNHTNEAIFHYETAIKIKPYYLQAHINLANLYFHMGNYPMALKNYLNAYKLDPTDTGTLNGLGGVMIKTGHIEKGLHFFSLAYRINPEDSLVIKNIESILILFPHLEKKHKNLTNP